MAFPVLFLSCAVPIYVKFFNAEDEMRDTLH